MAISVASVVATCSVCGEPLNRKGRCLACLLRAALDKSDVESAAPVSLVFGDFEIARREDGSRWELGRGAMGVTYLAVDQVLRRKVAIKVIEVPTLARSSDAVHKRFLREARAAAALRHPNVAAVYQFGGSPDGSRRYYAMELVEGETLEGRVRRDGPLKPSLVLEIAIQVSRALMAASAHGLIHRDLKPGNIMLEQGDAAEVQVKVIDFGLAKAIADAESEMDITHGEFVGTPNFASPEQFESGPVDVRSDIYSLGATLWFALTGKTPFAGRNIEEIRRAHKSETLPIEQLKTARVPSSVRSLLRSMLAIEPAARPSASELAARLRRCSAQASSVQHNRVAIAFTVILILGASAFLVFRSLRTHPATAESVSNSAVPEKRIAVLPFENLSNDREDASFADGVQDDLLTKLAKIADLKVISRASVMQYRGKQDTHEIGGALHVSHVLEGSVRKTGAWLHINAQLIDTRSDTHVWAEQYDRDLKDLFAIQSEIAQKVAERLHAKVSAAEKVAIKRPPTADLTAFDLYNRAKELLLDTVVGSTATRKASLLKAADLLNQAVLRDPTFFQAYCQLAWTHDYVYFDGWDHTPARLKLAEAAVHAASRLRPDAGEVHLARAWNLYWGYRDYEGALTEVESARPTLPNDPWVFQLIGFIRRRQGRWDESTQNLERALDLDPRNFNLLRQIAILYDDLRRYADQQAVLDRAIALRPDDLEVKIDRANVEIDWKANTEAVHQLIDEIQAKDPGALKSVADYWLLCALAERDAAAAANALAALGDNSIGTEKIKYGPGLIEGLIARMTKDDARAHVAFTAARAEQEKLVSTNPDDAGALCILGLVDAGLGRNDEALREGRRGVELLPVEKDARSGPAMIVCLARIAAWVGANDLACEQLARASRLPSSVSYGDLKLMPWWDPLRGNPCFEQILASLAPKGNQSVASVAASGGNPTTSAPPEKRIAVLPFQNLSKDEENAFFVGGMQDEILTDLAKVADLKVISRTSVMKYKSDLERNLREIAKTLAVSHVVEGSVQRAGGRVRVNVQLIDARNDAHLWAEHYDRDLADVFAIQSEIAQTIADQLQAKLSPKEKAAIAEGPTKNLAAYDLYLRAKELIYEVYLYPSREKENALKAVQLLDQAVARDPTFLLAHCQLGYEHDLIYFDDIDHTEARLALAETSVRAAVRLQPEAGETHLAQATHFYWGYHNYDRAREELAKAQRALPNNAEIFHFLGLIAHRQGHWDEIIPNLEHAVDLDPRNASTLLDLGEFYAILRKHREAIAMFDRAVAVEPRSAAMRMYPALIRVEAYADMVSLRTVLNTIEAEGPESAAEVAVISFELALRERDPSGAARAFANLSSENYIRQADYRVPRAWHKGLLAKLRQDAPAAHAAFIAARVETEKLVRTQPQNVKPLSVLALIDAELGDKEKAIREGRTACDMAPVSKDAWDGARAITILASIYALTGEKDLALEQLETVSKIPCGPSYGGLLLDPEWDLIRGDPRFEKIVASLAPNGN